MLFIALPLKKEYFFKSYVALKLKSGIGLKVNLVVWSLGKLTFTWVTKIYLENMAV